MEEGYLGKSSGGRKGLSSKTPEEVVVAARDPLDKRC